MGSVNFFILIFSFLTLLISGFLFLNNFDINLIQNILKIILIFGSIPLWFEILKDIYKGNFGVDLIAGLALLGTFLVGEYLSGVVILLMLSGGEVLEIYAMNRAKRELSALISKNPSLAHVKKGEKIEDVNIEEVQPNMLVVIKSGEIVSVDGVVVEGKTEIDESVLTGESAAILKQIGSQVYSGTTNTGSAIVVKVLKDPKETKYQEIIKLVENAQESKAPIMRLADRYAVYFTILTLIIAALAYFISGDWTRVVAVLVVATPCPLILATPIAIMSGMSKSSKRGIVVKDGSALENLASISTFIFDKTGTVTLGEPQVSQVFTFSDLSQNEVLKISASLDQLSSHILARSLLKKTSELNLNLAIPENFSEIFGDGVEGQLENKKYFFGKKSFVQNKSKNFQKEAEEIYEVANQKNEMIVYLADEEKTIGAITFKDLLRNDAGELFTKLKNAGIKNLIMLTGDKKEKAKEIGEALGLSQIISEVTPKEKLENVQNFQKENKVAMVGDGVNDAPALAIADVGIALGSHGKTATSDVADMVILSQSIGKVYDVFHIAKKTIYLAKQGIFLGIGASFVAMLFSAFGFISPLYGAILQEGIDVIVILNALRLGSIIDLD